MKHARRWLLVLSFAVLTGACARENRSEAPPGGEAAGLPGGAVAALRPGLDAYEEIRAALARDRLDGVNAASSKLAASLGATGSALDPRSAATAGTALESALQAARSLGDASDLAAARDSFGELSRALIPLVASDPRLRDGLHVNECPMTHTFKRWMQRKGGVDNPYMGKGMATCGSMVSWDDTPAPVATISPVIS